MRRRLAEWNAAALPMAMLVTVIVDIVVTPFLVPIIVWSALTHGTLVRASFGLVVASMALKTVLRYQLTRTR